MMKTLRKHGLGVMISILLVALMIGIFETNLTLLGYL